jgi:hypothetical protein
MRKKLMQLLNDYAENIGVLLGLSLILSFVFLDGIILTILASIFFLIAGILILLAYLQSKGWKYQMEKKAEQRSLNIQIPNFNLYHVIYYSTMACLIILWVLSEKIERMFHLSNYFFYSFIALFLLHYIWKFYKVITKH